MRPKVLSAAAMLVLTVAITSAAIPTAVEEKEVMAAMDAWIKAAVTQDTAALQKILHDELMYSHSDPRSSCAVGVRAVGLARVTPAPAPTVAVGARRQLPCRFCTCS